MAALPKTSFTLLLREETEHPLPDSDPDVIAALNAYGAVLNKAKKYAADCLDLLAGLMWVHHCGLRVAPLRMVVDEHCLPQDRELGRKR